MLNDDDDDADDDLFGSASKQGAPQRCPRQTWCLVNDVKYGEDTSNTWRRHCSTGVISTAAAILDELVYRASRYHLHNTQSFDELFAQATWCFSTALALLSMVASHGKLYGLLNQNSKLKLPVL